MIDVVLKTPSLLAFDTVGTGPTSLKVKIDKITEVVPFERLREIVVANPKIFHVPAQNFKLRYMLAENIGVMSKFLINGFMTGQDKVWARFCYLDKHRGTFNMNNVYAGEKRFNHNFSVNSDDLMQRYPLDKTALARIEQDYQVKTGINLKLDQQELTMLDIE